MTQLIIGFGGLLVLAGVLIMINPNWVFGPIKKYGDLPALHVIAVVMRLVLGYLLISQAHASSFPQIIGVLGWLAIVAAVAFAVMGRNNFKRMLNWATGLIDTLGRVAGLLAMAFGAFLIFAFI